MIGQAPEFAESACNLHHLGLLRLILSTSTPRKETKTTLYAKLYHFQDYQTRNKYHG